MRGTIPRSMGHSRRKREVGISSRALSLASTLFLGASFPGLIAQEGPKEPVELPASDEDEVAGEWWNQDRLCGELCTARTLIEERGFAIDVSWIVDLGRVLSGGVDEESAAISWFDVAVTADLETIAGLSGGAVVMDAYAISGGSLLRDIGDYQGTSNIESHHVAQIAELYYEQTLWDGKLRLKLGKVDAGNEFGYVLNGWEYLNSGFSYSPTFLSFPIYPDPATSVNAFVRPCEGWEIGGGVYDGALQEGISTGKRGPSTFLGEPSDLFLIGEVIKTWCNEGGLDGRFAVGSWHHTGTFDEFDGGTRNGTTGLYFSFDQTLWRENPDAADDVQGVAGFAQVRLADDEVSEVESHLSTGLAWTGPFAERDSDVLGLGLTRVDFSSDAGFTDAHETTLELFYRLQLLPWLSLKPDLQFAQNPGGDETVDDAWVALLRIEAVF